MLTAVNHLSGNTLLLRERKEKEERKKRSEASPEGSGNLSLCRHSASQAALVLAGSARRRRSARSAARRLLRALAVTTRTTRAVVTTWYGALTPQVRLRVHARVCVCKKDGGARVGRTRVLCLQQGCSCSVEAGCLKGTRRTLPGHVKHPSAQPEHERAFCPVSGAGWRAGGVIASLVSCSWPLPPLSSSNIHVRASTRLIFFVSVQPRQCRRRRRSS